MSGNRPKLSIIIPFFNEESFLLECVQALLLQGLAGFEVVLVDDGSEDASAEIALSVVGENKNMKLVTQENLGLGAARNAGVSAASGDFICFLDADDSLNLECLLNRVVPFAEDAGLDLALFDTAPFGSNQTPSSLLERMEHYYKRDPRALVGAPGKTELLDSLITLSSLKVSACLYLVRASFLKASGHLFRAGALMEDNAFTFKLLSSAKHVGHSGVSAHRRLVRPDSISQASSSRRILLGYLLALADVNFFLLTSGGPQKHWQRVYLRRLILAVVSRLKSTSSSDLEWCLASLRSSSAPVGAVRSLGKRAHGIVWSFARNTLFWRLLVFSQAFWEGRGKN